MPGPLLTDGGAAGDLRHGGRVRHPAHRRAQRPYHVPGHPLPGPDGGYPTHRPILAEPAGAAGRRLHRLSGLSPTGGGCVPGAGGAGGAGYPTLRGPGYGRWGSALHGL